MKRLFRPKHIYFLVLPKVHLLDLGGPAQVFTQPHVLGDLRLHYISPEPELVSAQGLQLANLSPLPSSLADDSWLLIIGSANAHKTFAQPAGLVARNWLQKMDLQETLLACVCSGALLAARAGLLNGRQCTTHHHLIPALQQSAPAARVVENRIFVGDGLLWTSAGISTGIDLCLYLISQVWGHSVATQIARDLVLYHRRSGDEPQLSAWMRYRNHVHDRVHQVQDYIMAEPAHDWRLSELAAKVYLSKRHLSRLFYSQTGVTIGDYLQALRLSLAKQLLENPGLSLEQVASDSGFGSPRQFRRVWRDAFSMSPSQSRQMLTGVVD